ncbi:hypothetical protein AC579_3404 [Pseudocercospora musae]|uniref:Uncharacterized protein n=1 Tax=Pseudocercospora musae TaxID=113226 RepID=A0A139ILL0_9PEZI|nr:hypothetical protein AC579_3404 [Pseudocercospora musae]
MSISASAEAHVNITQCLDQVKQAFHDGGAILEKIKKKRALKRAPPPPRLLEESLDQAPAEIEKEKQRAVTRFGKAFEHGDTTGIIHLQQITIQLQAALLEKLRNTAFDDENKTTDFSYLSDVVDSARDRTITALHELKQRLLSRDGTPTATQNATPNSSSSNLAVHAQVIPEEPPQPSQAKPHNARSFSLVVPPQQQHPPPPTRHHRTWSRDFTHSRDASGEEDTTSGADENQSHSHNRKRSSLLHFLKHHRSTSTEAQKALPAPVEEPQRQSSISPAGPTSAPFQPPPAKSTGDLTSNGPERKSFQYEEWEDNPSEIWGSKPSMDRRETMALAPDAQSPNAALIRHASNTSNPLQPPSPVLTNRSNSLNPSFHGVPSTALPTPNPENEYLGFCKGAWKLQNGDRKSSFGKCREVDAWSRHPSSANAAHYLACNTNKCAFRSNFSHVDINVVWSRVFAVPSKGIKLRWTFLAKSHVLQKVVVKHQYSFNCLFCVFLTGKSGVYHGIDYYLDHIASEHRGSRNLGEIILYKTGCIADHKAEDSEEFDINLWPLEEAQHKPRQQSEWLNDDLLWQEAGHSTNKDAKDSMFSANEPWNEGLSDFHYRGADDRTELD